MKTVCLDHLVLTVMNVETTIALYAMALGMQPVSFGASR